MLSVHSFTFNIFAENTYLLYDQTGECIIIDPGCDTESEKQKLIDFIEKQNLRVEKILITHAHLDHLMGVPYLRTIYPKVELLIPRLDEELLIKKEPNFYPILGTYESVLPDTWLKGGEQITCGEFTLDTVHLPGHTPGHMIFFYPEKQLLFSGDTLFKGTIGRTDLPFGDGPGLVQNIRNYVHTLHGDTIIYPGHGPVTTIKEERAENPFLKE